MTSTIVSALGEDDHKSFHEFLQSVDDGSRGSRPTRVGPGSPARQLFGLGENRQVFRNTPRFRPWGFFRRSPS